MNDTEALSSGWLATELRLIAAKIESGRFTTGFGRFDLDGMQKSIEKAVEYYRRQNEPVKK